MIDRILDKAFEQAFREYAESVSERCQGPYRYDEGVYHPRSQDDVLRRLDSLPTRKCNNP